MMATRMPAAIRKIRVGTRYGFSFAISVCSICGSFKAGLSIEVIAAPFEEIDSQALQRSKPGDWGEPLHRSARLARKRFDDKRYFLGELILIQAATEKGFAHQGPTIKLHNSFGHHLP